MHSDIVITQQFLCPCQDLGDKDSVTQHDHVSQVYPTTYLNFSRRGISPFYIEEGMGAAIGVWPAVIVIIHNLHIFVGGNFLSPRGAIFVPSPPPTPSYSIYMIALERDPCSKIMFTGIIIFNVDLSRF